MKVFVAGGGGAIGKSLIAQLVGRGYEVVAMARSEASADRLRKLGAEVAIADALDRAAVIDAVLGAGPEVIIHQLTALSQAKNLRNFDREFALTNRLRTEGTDHLLEAARRAGVRRFIAQSYGNWNYERTGSVVKTEDDRFDPNPPAEQTKSVKAIRYLESAVLGVEGIDGVALRYGNFYGPGNGISEGGEIALQVRERRLPIIGDGGGSGRSSTSTTPRRRQSPRSSGAIRVSTTSSTTRRRRSRRGCPSWREHSAPSRRGGFLSGLGEWSPVRSECR
jgi:nucleoside-diphosphate-sugar epimerase